jgi:hypothetical protein
LQRKSERLFLVGELEYVRQKKGEASGGKPATKDGDVELRIVGFIFVLTEPDAKPAEPEPGILPADSNRNPFVPLVPTKN